MILTYLDLVFDDDISASSVEGMLYESYFILFWLKLTFFFHKIEKCSHLSITYPN